MDRRLVNATLNYKWSGTRRSVPFEKATEKFASTVKKLHQDVEANRFSKTE
jgi:hypothetical protein